jgi:hypothetical protein
MINFIKKYWKILLPILIVGFIFSIYFIGVCNGKRNSNPTPADTTGAYVKRIQVKDAKILLDNTVLAAQNYLLNDSIKTLNKQLTQGTVVIIKEVDKIKKLPLDSAVKMMADNFNDKHIITMQVDGKDTGVVITPLDTRQVNIDFAMKNYFKSNIGILKSEVRIYSKKDSLNKKIIANDSIVIGDKDKSVVLLTNDNDNLQKELKTMTSKYKRQRFFKDVFEFTTLVSVIYAALK